MSKLWIGWHEESLVPKKKVSLAGQFIERISEYVESEISVTAMAVEREEESMILCSADIVNLSEPVLNLARQKLAALTDEIDPMNLIVAATHTHTSMKLDPMMNGATGFGSYQDVLNEFLPDGKAYTPRVTPDDTVLSPMEATEWFTDKIALCALRAWENRAEACYAPAFGRVAVGMCRRVAYDDGSAQMWGDVNTANFTALEGGNDSGMELIYTFDKYKNITGVVANIACPAQILEHRHFVSADYWGRAKANIRKVLGEHVHLLGICGAAGDQCPRDLVRWVNPETPIEDPNVKRPNLLYRRADPSMYDVSGCNVVGRRIANEILGVLEEVNEYYDDAVLRHETMTLDLPLRKATMAEYHHAVREMEYYVAQNRDKEIFDFEDMGKMHVHAGTILRYRRQQYEETVPIELHVVRLGDVAFVTNPFELFLDYGNYIKARSPFAQTFVAQLCCGSLGYLPTAKAEKGGHYSAYISSGNVGHEGGDLLVRKTLAELFKMANN